ncbi:MAG: cadherin-like beta sandwich domain-containing protein [Prevotellaceae bacterium]|nr:cadherin-like beta sandwich domain-containing protein [Prevotellaceae bacterium]
MQDNLYQYKQYSSRGYVSKIEGYLAGIWDMPDSLITLKNYRHTDITSMIYNSECECYDVINVQAEGIVTLYKNELYNLYGGKRNPDYLSCSKDYNSVVVVLSVNEFLDDNLLKAYHYGSIVLETEGTSLYYNSKYDEIFSYFSGTIPDQYWTRQLNPYHATYGNLHFKTQLFSSSITDATLSSLTVSSGDLLFDANTTSYTVNVANEVTSIDVTGTANHTAATVAGNVTGKALNVGDNEINITVTAEDGVTTKTYTVTVVRENAAIVLTAFSLDNNANIALSRTVDLVYTFSGGVPTEYIAGEKPDLSGSQWKTYNPAELTYSFVSDEYGIKTVYTRLRDDKGETGIMNDVIYYKPFYEVSVNSFDENYDQTRSIIGSLYDKSVSVYPNPVETFANISIENIESPAGKVEIYSLTGTMYLSQKFSSSKFSLDMSRCPSGIFLVKLTVGDVQVTKRIIKL